MTPAELAAAKELCEAAERWSSYYTPCSSITACSCEDCKLWRAVDAYRAARNEA